MNAQSPFFNESEEVPKRTMLIKMFLVAKNLRFGKTLYPEKKIAPTSNGHNKSQRRDEAQSPR